MGLWVTLLAIFGVSLTGVAALARRDGWLRAETPAGASEHARNLRTIDGNYVGIAEIARFSAMRRRVGFKIAGEIMQALASRVTANEGFTIDRIGRSSISFVYRADTFDAARLMMRDLRKRLEETVKLDSFEFDPDIVVGSNPVCAGELRDELFDAAAFAVEDARALPDRICLASERAVLRETDPTANMLYDLRAAIKGDTLNLHYMPKLRLRDDAIVCAEALCRWTHPEHGTVAPPTFIELAEDSGLIGDLTLWALSRAFEDRNRLAAEGIDLAIDVNLSALLIANTEFCDQVIERIACAKGGIGLEITETGAISDTASALENLERLRSHGIRIAIDDFGSGLASLSYLRQLPAHELKIDQMFVSALTTSNRDPLLVRSAIDIAHALEMEVTAEGVADEIALALLRVMRCDNAQGFHISPPLPLHEIARFLRSRAEAEILPGDKKLRATG